MKAAIYARYSSELQRESSIDDQVRVCRDHIARLEAEPGPVYADSAISGAKADRPRLVAMMEDAKAGKFQIVVAEALDRLSRDQEHMAALFKRLSFAGVRIFTISEGEISELHVGLKGTMNALFLKDLGAKTYRSLRGLIEQGRSAGGCSYGYDVVRNVEPEGCPRGKRRVNPEQAEIVLRIFSEFAAGRSPRAIAFDLNRERITPPREGKVWSPSAIYGNWRRGTGILNNELYVGRLVWNRQHFVKDPDTGRRQARPNPPEQWHRNEVSALRIVPQDLWDKVKLRQSGHRHERPEKARRPVHLLSGLLVCGACGGGMSKISAHHYGCSRARNSGTCANRLTIRRDYLEATILEGLRQHLMQPAAVKAFLDEFTREANRLASEHDGRRNRLDADLAKIDRKQRALMDAIVAGTPARLVNAELTLLEAQRSEIVAELTAAPPPLPRLHPNLPALYRRKVDDLQQALAAPETATQAGLALRGLIDRIRLVPIGRNLEIHLEGARAALMALGSPETQHPRGGASGVQVTMVAGAGFEPATFRL